MPVIHNLFKQHYIYRQCNLADIQIHFKKVQHWIPPREGQDFRARMKECVDAGTAWKTDNTFLYYKTDGHVGVGIALFGMDHPLEIMALMMGVFSYRDKTTHALRFKLHPGKNMREYKSLLTTISMARNGTNSEHPLMVRVDELRKRWSTICEKTWEEV